jgi:hypothetical protein
MLGIDRRGTRRGGWCCHWGSCYACAAVPPAVVVRRRRPVPGRRHALPDHPDEGNGATSLKKVLTWLAVAFVVFYVIQRPEDAAGIVRSAGAALGDAASSLSAFVGSVA